MDQYTYKLAMRIEQLHAQHEANIQSAFMHLFAGISDCDFTKIDHATEELCHEFGFKTAFDDQDEFDRFMLSDRRVRIAGTQA